MASIHKYEPTANAAMMWANSELEHVGRIALIKDTKLQYSYALLVYFELFELVTDPAYKHHKKDLPKTP